MLIRILAALLLSLPAGAETRPAVAPHTRIATASPAHPPDAELEKTIRARFARSKISTNRFEVHVQGGVATIEGKTDVVQHKGTATRLARLAGAASVVNKVQVSQAARDRASANLATGRRRAQVKRDQRSDRSPSRPGN